MHRSYLYVPGDRPDRLQKAMDSGADAVIADLEDGVAISAKERALDNVTTFLRDSFRSTEILVRVNPGERLESEVRALCGSGAKAAIYLPKAEMESVERLDALLSFHSLSGHSSSGEGSSDNELEIVALIETARGVLEAAAIAGHPRVRNLAIGEADLGAELGITASEDEREWSAIRTQLVLASASAGIDPPTGPVSTEFRDLDALRRSTDGLRRSGFGARSAIHPAQVAVINDAFTPDPDALRRARRLVELHDDAVANGDGVCLDDDGRMVDEAVVRSARRLLSRAPD